MMFIVFSEDSAMTEPAWSGAGESVSLKIWRIVVRFKLLVRSKNEIHVIIGVFLII
jgi:hypothetical protein